MEYKVYYVVPHTKYKRKKRCGFMWLKSKIEENDFSHFDLAEIILANKDEVDTAYAKYKLIIDSDTLKENMKRNCIDKKCFDIKYVLNTHNTNWIRSSDLEKSLTFEELTLYKKQILNSD